MAAGSWWPSEARGPRRIPNGCVGARCVPESFARPGCLLPPSLPPSRPLAATSRPGCASWWTGASCCSEPPRTTPANTPASPATGSGSHLQPQPSSRCCVRARGCPLWPPRGPQCPLSTPCVSPPASRSGAGDHHAPGDPFAQGDAGRDPVSHQGQPPPALRQLDAGRAPAGAGQGTATHGPPTPSPAPRSPPKSPPRPSHQLPGWSARPDGSIVIATGNDDALGVYTCTPYNSYGTAGASRPTRVLLKVGTDWGVGDGGHNTPASRVPATVPSTVRGSCRTPPPSPCAPRRNTSRRWAGSWWSPARPTGTPHPPSPGGRYGAHWVSWDIIAWVVPGSLSPQEAPGSRGRGVLLVSPLVLSETRAKSCPSVSKSALGGWIKVLRGSGGCGVAAEALGTGTGDGDKGLGLEWGQEIGMGISTRSGCPCPAGGQRRADWCPGGWERQPGLPSPRQGAARALGVHGHQPGGQRQHRHLGPRPG